MNTLRMGKRGRKKTNIEKRITNTFDDKAGDIIEDSNSAFPREIKIFKTPLKVVMYSGSRNPETRGGRPRKFNPRT